MPALLILNYDVHDAARLAAYRAAAAPVLVGPEAAALLASTAETVGLDEAPAAGSHTVILRFSSVHDARRVYESAEYRPLIDERLKATTPHFAVIVPMDED